jgi:prepilin-type N-terminal cleavage/methylation domain-containing protein
MIRFKFIGLGRRDKGYTLIELLIVAAIIGILLAIAIPNLIKARISANEAGARKSMQTLRDAEGEFFEQDLNNNGVRDFTNLIGDLTLDHSLRCPDSAPPGGGTCLNEDALVDDSFEGAEDAIASAAATCADSKSGYCMAWTSDASLTGVTTPADGAAPDPVLEADFGWEASMTSAQKNGRRDFGVFGDGAIRCTISTQATNAQGAYEVTRSGIPAAGACD